MHLRTAIAVLCCAITLLASAVPLRVSASSAPVPVRCGVPTEVFGAGTSARERSQISLLHARHPTALIREDMRGERAQSHGLIPRGLLGRTAVTSALVSSLAPGSPLTVTINRGITLDTAESFANALLTAGIRSGSVIVVAPPSQKSPGPAGLLDALLALRTSCAPTVAGGLRLAIREIVLTSRLARHIGRLRAPRLVGLLKYEATARNLTSRPALRRLIRRTVRSQGIRLPANVRASLVLFLHDLVTSKAYKSVIARGFAVQSVSPLLATARASSPVVAPAPTGQTIQGTVTTVTVQAVTVHVNGATRQFIPSTRTRISRNGGRVDLNALQRGDRITVTLNAGGQVVRMVARGKASPGIGRQVVLTVHGTLIGVGARSILLQQGTSRHRYSTAARTVITRNGVQTNLFTLRPGDSVTVVTSSSFGTLRVDATPVPARAPEQSRFTLPDLIALLALAAILLLFLVLYTREWRRWRRGRTR